MKTKAIKHALSAFTLALLGLHILSPVVYAIELVITDNGSSTTNEVSLEVETETEVVQSNEADVTNEVYIDSSTGENEIANSTSDEVSIETGDIVNDVSTETQVNYSEAIVECCAGGVSAEIVGNLQDSENLVELELKETTTVSIVQSADVENNMEGSANTGENLIVDSGGDATITTGDITVVGEVINSSINVYDVHGGSGSGDIKVTIENNAEVSVNTILLGLNIDNQIYVENSSDIKNNIFWDLNTGKNKIDGNLSDSEIITGYIIFDFLASNDPLNIGGVDWDCCGMNDKNCHDDNPEENSESDPTTQVASYEIGGNSGNSSGDSSGSGGSSNSSSDPLASILGLSDTTSKSAQSLFFWVGIVMIALGLKHTGEYLVLYNSSQQNR